MLRVLLRLGVRPGTGTGYTIKTTLPAKMTTLRYVFTVASLNTGAYIVSLIGDIDAGAVFFINGMEGSRYVRTVGFLAVSPEYWREPVIGFRVKFVRRSATGKITAVCFPGMLCCLLGCL